MTDVLTRLTDALHSKYRVYTRLTQTDQVEGDLTWTSDSRQIFYTRDVPQYEIFKRLADGSGPEQLAISSPYDKASMSVTPDGKLFLYADNNSVSGRDIFAAPVDPADKTPQKLLVEANGEQTYASVSPDSRWLLYTSPESGRPEVYVAAYPSGRGPPRQQASVAGGDHSYWANDGRAIYYQAADQIVRTAFDSQTGTIGKPETLAKMPSNIDWSIGPDGRFLLMKLAKKGEHRSFRVILNWTQTLRDISRPAR